MHHGIHVQIHITLRLDTCLQMQAARFCLIPALRVPATGSVDDVDLSLFHATPSMQGTSTMRLNTPDALDLQPWTIWPLLGPDQSFASIYHLEAA